MQTLNQGNCVTVEKDREDIFSGFTNKFCVKYKQRTEFSHFVGCCFSDRSFRDSSEVLRSFSEDE